MNKMIISLALIIVALLTIGGCQVETSTSFGLNIEDATLARENADGILVPVGDDIFQRGEVVGLVLLNVGKFKRGGDGKHWFDMDIEIKDPDGEIILSQKGLLGEEGHLALSNGIAETPHARYETTTELKPGIYKIKLTIYDKVRGGSASKSKSFTLE